MAKVLTQTELAKITGLSQQRLSQLHHRRIWHRADSPDSAIRKIIIHLGAVAGGRRGDGDLDLVQERARLSIAQTEKINFEMQRLRENFVPMELLVEIWSRQTINIKTRLLAIPNKVGSKIGAQTSDTDRKLLSIVDDEIREALTELASLPLPKKWSDKFKAWVDSGITR